MKILHEFAIVKVPTIFNDETKFKGLDGRQIMMNILHNPERHIRTYGIVTAVPETLTPTPLASDYTSAPAYHDKPANRRIEWKTCQDIHLEVQVGDKVYFHWNCLLPDIQGGSRYNIMHMYNLKEVENGKEVLYYYFRVKYSLIYAAVRFEKINAGVRDFQWWMEPELKLMTTDLVDDHGEAKKVTRMTYTDMAGDIHSYAKKIIPIGSYVIVEPDKETWRDISIPVFATGANGKVILGKDGMPQLLPEDKWIVTKEQPGLKYLQGWVKHVGTPLKGDKPFLEVGTYVMFQVHTNTIVTFEGEECFRMLQRHVICINDSKFRRIAA
jgi:hypothetical protein